MKSKRSVPILIAALLAIINLAAAPLALGATWTVTSHGDNPNDATTLRGALHVARDGDTIDLTGLTGAIVLTNGAAQILRELPVIYSVTIKGPGPDKLAIDGNAFSTVFHVYVGANPTISGLTIRNGLATVDPVTGLSYGGGIRNSGVLTLTHCAISGNSASGGGAGVFNLPGQTVTIDNCTFSNNTAVAIGEYDSVGGAIWNSSNDHADPSTRVSGTVTITNSAITNNSANTGGGIFNEGDLVIKNTTVSNNTATADFMDSGAGGGIVNDLFGSVTLVAVTVSNNSANGMFGYGGGLVTSNVATVTASTFSANSPEGINNDTTLTLTNSTIWGNKGDAVASLRSPGGYGYPASSVTIVNSTLAQNGGNGIANEGSNVYLRNTILSHNAKANCFNYNPLDPSATIASQDHNVSNDTTCAAYLTAQHDFPPGTDPGLDPGGLKDNGGPTQTVALKLSSVAVDAIAPADCAVSTDQRGISRPQGTNCDVGAYEATPDFDLSPIVAINASVGTSGSTTAKVNSYIGFQAPVTLTTSSAPAGIATSFTPDPVTPPSYGSASSTLTASIGPAVTPATYRIGVTGTSGTLIHSTSVNVIVGVTIAGVTQVVGADLAAGCIDNAGVANAITSVLAQAQADIDAGDVTDAKAALNDLVALLRAQRGKHIHTSCTVDNVTFDPDAVLIADVEALLATL